jgi:hypothetical protein
MLGIFKSKFTGDLVNGFASVKDLFFGNIYQFCLDVLLGGFAGFFFYQVAKIIG